ncbi:MAG: hypothetical protein BIP78_0566 [Candidatus Bipolaricaulis sibiricus]|uniref:Transposase IS200-like domain-containing protein n=1 Tax=Bipolaricaulis sibiricus TaxID=2501609 RepID=A0A410FTL6_BIPS1|nr:MAG: hypothetical protein BIP78_0566 [Candidatus Bipolaricaulis sibiricus]
MQYLNGVYTERFNRCHGRVGHLFQGRFTAILVKKESHLLEVARYVVLNPVRAGMVRDPGDWRWSSYRATAGLAPVPPFLTVDWIRARFGDDPATAGRAYRRFVDAGRGAKVWNDLRGGWLLGSPRFADAVRPLLEAKPVDREHPRLQRAAVRPSLEDLFAAVRDKGTRDERIYEAVRLHGYTLREVAERVGLAYPTVSIIAKRVAERKRAASGPEN